MTEEVENLVIEHLKALRNELHDLRVEVRAGFAEMRERMTHLERAIAGIKRDQAHLFEVAALQQVGLDKLTERVDRIERRLELSDAP